MTRLLVTFFVLGLAFGAVPALGQGPRPDFSGTWEMDTTRFEKLDPVLAALTLTIQQGPDTLGVKMDVGDRLGPSEPLKRSTTLTRYLLNGEPLQNRMGNGTMASSTLSWDHETLVMRASGPAPDGQQLEITTRWTMEAHGARLVQQQRMQHGQRVANQTLLLSRR